MMLSYIKFDGGLQLVQPVEFMISWEILFWYRAWYSWNPWVTIFCSANILYNNKSRGERTLVL